MSLKDMPGARATNSKSWFRWEMLRRSSLHRGGGATLVGYESILNMSQKVEGVPVSIGALPFRRNLSSAYGAAVAAYYGAGASGTSCLLGCGPQTGKNQAIRFGDKDLKPHGRVSYEVFENT